MISMLAGSLGPFGGLRVVEDINLVDYIEDWSRVRSPGRARRRRAKHPQRIAIRAVPKPDAYRIGDTMVMHPETVRKLRHLIQKQDIRP